MQSNVITYNPNVRIPFESYKSNICHYLRILGDRNFIRDVLLQDNITKYWTQKWYPECFYLLAMLDYISRLNGISLCTRYDNLRRCSLESPLYPRDIELICIFAGNDNRKKQALEECIPEFKHYNIIESDIRNVY